jgi:amidase
MGGDRAMNDVLFRSATAAADALRRKEISSGELTELLFARLGAVNPGLNAVIEQRREAALAEAAAADAATARGDARGPLHGVPVTIKESFNVAGMHTTWGNPAFQNFVAERDATVVRRLRQSGAIIAAKTNVAFMLGDFAQTANDQYGVTNNPWDPSRTPGGSSGGAAAAVAAGLSFADCGTDLVGSVRIPASFCGVYGLRPTASTVPLTGMQPPGAPVASSDVTWLSSAGPVARSAGDLRALLRELGGPEDAAAKAYAWTLAPPRHTRLAEFRVGVVLDHESAPMTAEVDTVLSAVLDAVADAGVTIVEGWPDGVDPVQSAESFGFQVGLFFGYTSPGSQLPDFADVVEAEGRRSAVRAAWARYFDGIDVFLCPVNFTPAFAHDARPFEQRTIATPEGERPYAEQPFWTAHAALAGLPAVAAPAGLAPSGLPVGIQVIGPQHEDDTAITFAELLADVAGGYERPPVEDLGFRASV